MTLQAIEMHLQLVESRLRDLKAKQTLSREQFLSDPTSQGAVTYWLVQAIESCIQMGAAIVALRKLPTSEAYKDIFRTLYHQGVISEPLKERLVAMVGFRNLAIHVYWKIDPDELYKILQSGLSDIEEFALVAAKIFMPQ
jgi:uncharacterized protein YutE (UPF0331/DUF86 family)